MFREMFNSSNPMDMSMDRTMGMMFREMFNSSNPMNMSMERMMNMMSENMMNPSRWMAMMNETDMTLEDVMQIIGSENMIGKEELKELEEFIKFISDLSDLIMTPSGIENVDLAMLEKLFNYAIDFFMKQF